MTECVILYRGKDERIQFVRDPEDPGEIAVFPYFDAAIAYCGTSELFKSGQADYQIVELDEL
jgi:hypothetical protein